MAMKDIMVQLRTLSEEDLLKTALYPSVGDTNDDHELVLLCCRAR